MGLTSLTLVVGLAVAAVGLTALTVLTWDIGRLRWPRRVVGLVLAQVVFLAFAGAYINRQEYFFASWHDLVGGADIADQPVGTSPAKVSGQGKSPAAFASYVRSAGGSGGHSVVTTTYVAGPRSRLEMPMLVYVPAAYFDPANAHRAFPVVQLFSGYPGSLQTWSVGMKLQPTLDDLIARKAVQPMIAEVALQYPSPPRDSECVNAAGGDQVDTFLSGDIPDYLKASLRTAPTRNGWATFGVSTGGFCAANLALRHPNQYAAVGSIGGYFHAIVDHTTGDLYRGSRALRDANTPINTVRNHKRPPLSFYLFGVRDDRSSYPSMRRFVANLAPPDGWKVVEQESGGHNDALWRSAALPCWRWLSGLLKV